MQVLRDLCVMARADDQITRAEREKLCEIAHGLGVPKLFVDRALEAEPDLD